MAAVKFLSDEWLAALADAADARVAPVDDPLADLALVIEQRVHDGPVWQIVIDHGSLSIRVGDGGADVRLSSDRATAAAIASGREAALDSFMVGRLTIGGDMQRLVDHRAALETVGDLFAQVKADTVFD